jgi:hypothetical protein
MSLSGGQQNFYFIIQKLSVKTALDDKIHHLRENLIGMLATVAYATHPQGYQLPQILILHLSHRDIKPISDPGGDRFQYLPLALEGLIFGQTQSYFADAYVHLQ